ncbi:hypothetical protein A0H81_05642 [Grifola frondosa]|uniref:Alpha-type protein kinase domain-containing protein n=1 Tax=Grifola frondosa TaxID=5627 RepID=A0A1C7MDU7_GRIFR|nr:hypothetical protein A0H81_05642 [Grifola frondosa]
MLRRIYKISGQECPRPIANVPSDADHDRAPFLCFAQHVQYFYSGCNVFASDFQGAEDLLTDCQIITSSDYVVNFGEGNLAHTFDQFEDDHQCNEYCIYFGLSKFSSSTTTSLSVLGPQDHKRKGAVHHSCTVRLGFGHDVSELGRVAHNVDFCNHRQYRPQRDSARLG